MCPLLLEHHCIIPNICYCCQRMRAINFTNLKGFFFFFWESGHFLKTSWKKVEKDVFSLFIRTRCEMDPLNGAGPRFYPLYATSSLTLESPGNEGEWLMMPNHSGIASCWNKLISTQHVRIQAIWALNLSCLLFLSISDPWRLFEGGLHQAVPSRDCRWDCSHQFTFDLISGLFPLVLWAKACAYP